MGEITKADQTLVRRGGTLRILFAGSPEIAVPSLVRLSFEQEIVGILTNPESQKGRGLCASCTPVAEAAASLFQDAVPVLTFDHLGAEARRVVAELHPDLLVSFAYGRIFGPKFLGLFPMGGINVHPSLLPRYRGPTPIPEAILRRDEETGVTVQRIALGVDEGDVFRVERIKLRGRETAADLAETASLLGADLLSRVIEDLAAGRAEAHPQEGKPSLCRLLHKDDGLVDWRKPVVDIDALIRALYPWPGTYTYFNGKRLMILEALSYPGVTFAAPSNLEFEERPPGTVLGLDKAMGLMVQGIDGLIALRRLQLQHKRALSYREFANGVRGLTGAFLGAAGDV